MHVYAYTTSLLHRRSSTTRSKFMRDQRDNDFDYELR